MDIFKEIDKKKAELARFGLSTEAKKKLDKKLHLEWSFHSNHMEGNTLTYGQTQMLLIFGKAMGDKEKREYDEMEAHHIAVKIVEEWAADQTRELTERDIRELNQIILVKPFWKEAIDSLDQKTKRLITPGEYKQMPNSVRLANGEMHEYASPEETPSKMSDLMDEYRKLLEQKEHPIFIASWFHHRFVAIHPFDDGNGRVARLLANYILLRHHYTPIVIKTENKADYLTALQQADIGDLEPFVQFMTQELHWSMDMAIKAANGESLEEEDDLDKQIALLDKKLKGMKSNEIKVEKNEKVVIQVFNESIFPLMLYMDEKLKTIKTWFNTYQINYSTNSGGKMGQDLSLTSRENIEESIKERLPYEIRCNYLLRGFKKAGADAFDISFDINFRLEQWRYDVYSDKSSHPTIKKMYHENLSKEEIESICKDLILKIKENIEFRLDA